LVADYACALVRIKLHEAHAPEIVEPDPSTVADFQRCFMSDLPLEYEFDSFRIDRVKRLLLRDGKPIPLNSKSFDTLLALVERHGQVINKDDLMKALWPDTSVEENNITQQISVVRKALGERAGEHRYVVTVPGRGYSFVADVREQCNGNTNLIVEEHTRGSITVDVEEEQGNGVLVSSPPNGGFIRQQNVKYVPLNPKVQSARKKSVWALLLIALVMVSLGSVLVWRRWFGAAHKTDVKRSIAVLPFKSLNNDPATDYLGTGMSDTLIAKLSNIQQISVRPTSAVIKYSVQPTDAQTVGRELGVDSVLEGTVQSVGERVRVTVQLINVQDRNPLWAQSFSERLTDIFDLQDTISEQVAQTMLLKLNGDEQRQLRKRDTNSLEAYREYLEGRFFWNKRNEEGLRKSVEHFNRAISIDQSYAKAYAGLADSYIVITYYGATSVSYESAKAAAVKALEIDNTLAEAHTSLAVIKSVYDHDDRGAETEFTKAIQLNPNYATAHHWYSDYLAMRDRQTEALAEIKRAQELDPLSPVINTTLGEQLHYSRQYDEAIVQLRRTLELEPNFAPAHYTLGLVLEQKGMFDQAISEFQKALVLSGTTLGISAALAHTYALSGQKAEARRILKVLLGQQTASAPYDVAMVYQGLGEKEQAIDWLRKLKDKKADLVLLLRSDPRLDGLRSDSRFKEIFQKDFKDANS